jgi:hypothetical protein
MACKYSDDGKYHDRTHSPVTSGKSFIFSERCRGSFLAPGTSTPVDAEALRKDVPYALRVLRQSPVFTTAAAISLALGIGANAAIVTLVAAILLRWLPVPNPQEPVGLARNPSQPTTASSYPDYCYLRDHRRSYAGLFAFWSGGVTRFRVPDEGTSQTVVSSNAVSGVDGPAQLDASKSLKSSV